MSAVRDKTFPVVGWPTPDDPHVGTVGLGDEFPLSKVAYWQQDGMHVFRSVEYDLQTADEDIREAILAFVHGSIDYARFLSEPDDPAPADLAIANMIFDRALRINEEINRRKSGPLAIRRFLQGHRHLTRRDWYRDLVAQI
jgi:hypothetical protein